MDRKLVRWILEPPSDPPVRAQERLVDDILGPLVQTMLAPRQDPAYYVSKQGAHRVWLTVVGALSAIDRVRSQIEHKVDPFLCETCVSDSDKLLEASSTSYLMGLTHTTTFAIDVHLSDDLPARQRFLVRLMCSGSATPEAIHSLLAAFSSSYRQLTPEQTTAYLHSFYQPGPSTELSFYGHWLWNIVVGGKQPLPGQDAGAIIQALGVA